MIRSKSGNNDKFFDISRSPGQASSDNSAMTVRDLSAVRLPGSTKLWNFIKILCALGIAIFILDYLLSSEYVLPEHRRQPMPPEDRITVVMNTFKRNDMMIG